MALDIRQNKNSHPLCPCLGCALCWSRGECWGLCSSMQIPCVWNCLFWLKKNKSCGTRRCEVLPDGFWEILFWREPVKWPLQTLFWGFVSLQSALARAISLAECEIRFKKSFCYSEISPRQGCLTTGPVHQCWNALLSLSFFVRCMRPHFSELFGRKLNGKSGRSVSRARAVSTSRNCWSKISKFHDAVSWLCDPESFPSCATW